MEQAGVSALSNQNQCQASMELANFLHADISLPIRWERSSQPRLMRFWGMAVTMGSGEIRSWLLVCGCEAPQLLTPIQDDIDLEGLTRFTTLPVDQEPMSIRTHIKSIQPARKSCGHRGRNDYPRSGGAEIRLSCHIHAHNVLALAIEQLLAAARPYGIGSATRGNLPLPTTLPERSHIDLGAPGFI